MQDAAYARLLIESIRAFGGDLHDCPVWVFCLENLRAIKNELGFLNVQLFQLQPPTDVLAYPFGVKVFACAAAEQMAAPMYAPAPAYAPAGVPAAAPAATDAPAATAAPEPQESGHYVRSPMVGTFYTAASPDAPAFAEVGTTDNKGDALCIVEAMKMMNQIQSDVSGVVKAVLVENGDAVEFDEPLFIIE